MHSELYDKLREAVDSDPRIRASACIDINEDNGRVTLHGPVGNLNEFHAAEQIAQSVDGVSFVLNHLTIEGDDTQGPSCPLA